MLGLFCITLHVIHAIYIIKYYITIKLTSIFHNLKKVICLGVFLNKNHCTKIKCKVVYMAIYNNVRPRQKLQEKKIFRQEHFQSKNGTKYDY